MSAKTCQNLPKTLFIVATELEATIFRGVQGARVVVSGVGPVEATIAVMEVVRDSPDIELLVQVGIAGAVDSTLQLGEVVVVGSDTFLDLGAWRGGERECERECERRDIEGGHFERFSRGEYTSDIRIEGLRTVAGGTVTMACNPLLATQNATTQIETMEGASFLKIAQHYKIPALQIRAISNYTTQHRKEWQIETALKNLREVLHKKGIIRTPL